VSNLECNWNETLTGIDRNNTKPISDPDTTAGLDGCTLWGLIREYVQAEAMYQRHYANGGPGSSITKTAAEQVTRTETAARDAFQKLLPTNVELRGAHK
jgi:hypothetical protein